MIYEDTNEKVTSEDVTCWGLRYSPLRVRLTNPNNYVKLIQKVEADLRTLGEGVCFTMEPEDKDNMGYIYIMFFDKATKDAFFSKHKNEKAYKDGKITDIFEPAYLPRKMFPDDFVFRNKA